MMVRDVADKIALWTTSACCASSGRSRCCAASRSPASRADLAIRPLSGRPARRRTLAVAPEPPPAATRAMLEALREAAATYATPA